MKVTLLYFKDEDKEWASLLIDNISVGQQAVKDIVGNTLVEQTLHPHGLYSKEMDDIINIGTAKKVFRNICERMYDKTPIIMNINGGYVNRDSVDWELVKSKTFDVHYDSSLLDLLKQENGKEKPTFNEIIED